MSDYTPEKLLRTARDLKGRFPETEGIEFFDHIIRLLEGLQLHEGGRSGLPLEERGDPGLFLYLPFLRELPLFASFGYENLVTLVPAMELKFFQPGEKIISRGDPDSSLYIILWGEVEVKLPATGDTGNSCVLGSGELIGEMALVTGKPRSADVFALKECSLILLQKDLLDGLCRKNPEISNVLTQVVIQRLSSDNNSMVSRMVGNYCIERVIGKGGMGVVYLANDERLGRRVALKMLPHRLCFDGGFVAQFNNEARLMATMEHENIVRLYDVLYEYSTYFMALEYMDDGSLKGRLQQTPRLPIPEAMRVIDQIGKALDYSRSLGIVHRDIKPDNIMYHSGDKIKLMDFGIAVSKLTRSVSDKPGMVNGTLGYMSPEQSQGLEIDFRSDIYTFGVVCYQMLTGKLPFEGSNLLAITLLQVSCPPPRPSALNPEVPPWLDDFVFFALKPKPEERLVGFANVREVIRRIQQGFLPLNFKLPEPNRDFHFEGLGASQLQRGKEMIYQDRAPLGFADVMPATASRKRGGFFQDPTTAMFNALLFLGGAAVCFLVMKFGI